MPIRIITKNPVTHSVNVVFFTVLIFIAVGTVARLRRESSKKVNITTAIRMADSFSSALLVPSIALPVSNTAPESEWVKALAKAIRGDAEVTVAFGRADVMTGEYAIEIDFLQKWKEGLGQALHYGTVSQRIPVLALIILELPNEDLIKHIDTLTYSRGVRLVLLTPQ